jgi:hypothetical protein
VCRWGLVALAACLAAPAAAGAHGETSPLIRSVIDGVEPRPEGVRFRTVSGQSALIEVTNRGGQDVTMLGTKDVPFLRVGPRGVFGNLHAPDWYRSGNPDGVAGVALRREVRPRWTRVARKPVWAYYEHRMHPRRVLLPEDEDGTERTLRLLDWKVPFDHGGRRGLIEGHIEFRPILGAVVPSMTSGARPLPGVTVRVLPGRWPGMLMQSTSTEPVTVEGRDGEPFARFSRRGVEVNLHSPVYVEGQKARGLIARLPADAEARPRWETVSPVPSFTWIEPRARYAPEQPPDPVVQRGEPTRLVSWAVPLKQGERRVEVRGLTSWLPNTRSGVPEAPDEGGGGGDAVWWLIGGAAAVGLAVAAALRLRRRAAVSTSSGVGGTR